VGVVVTAAFGKAEGTRDVAAREHSSMFSRGWEARRESGVE
jgi:hypothetical protein